MLIEWEQIAQYILRKYENVIGIFLYDYFIKLIHHYGFLEYLLHRQVLSLIKKEYKILSIKWLLMPKVRG